MCGCRHTHRGQGATCERPRDRAQVIEPGGKQILLTGPAYHPPSTKNFFYFYWFIFLRLGLTL